MDQATMFRKHADECLRAGKSRANLEERAAWNRMGERWLRCAKQAEHEDAAARSLAASRKLKYRNAHVLRRFEHAA
jgi:hypothetical protein